MSDLLRTIALIAAIPLTAVAAFHALDWWLGRRRQHRDEAYTDDDDTEITP